MSTISNTTFEKLLINFINEARETVQLLQTSIEEEEGGSSGEDETPILRIAGMFAQNRISFQANMQSVSSVNHLRNSGRAINGILYEHPYLLEGCRMQSLSTDFDGESIKKQEEAEWEAGCCERMWGNPSYRTLQAIQSTLVKVQNVQKEAEQMLDDLHPEGRRLTCCRNFCIIS